MPTRGVRILIGEDDAIVALDIQAQLRRLGYQVDIRSGSAPEIVKLVKELKPNILLLDVNIHGDMHGVEVARAIHRFANVPIVFLSAFEADVFEKEGEIPSPYRYVIKPFAVRRVHAAIQELLAERTE
jgi:two-component system, sensor histidine kinase